VQQKQIEAVLLKTLVPTTHKIDQKIKSYKYYNGNRIGITFQEKKSKNIFLNLYLFLYHFMIQCAVMSTNKSFESFYRRLETLKTDNREC
jgi:hypothetical protein